MLRKTPTIPDWTLRQNIPLNWRRSPRMMWTGISKAQWKLPRMSKWEASSKPEGRGSPISEQLPMVSSAPIYSKLVTMATICHRLKVTTIQRVQGTKAKHTHTHTDINKCLSPTSMVCQKPINSIFYGIQVSVFEFGSVKFASISQEIRNNV